MDSATRNSTTRFSDRVDNYIKYRPSYPPEIVATLKEKCGMTANSIVADVGSGTGILTDLLLENGSRVFGIEPNREMREAAETILANRPGFTSIAGTAEDTGLPANSIDLVVAGQAFHWFDQEKAKVEFRRILRPDGWVALIWNGRNIDTSPFLKQYEELLLKHSTDYYRVNHMNIGLDILQEFFAPGTLRQETYANFQHFDLAGLKGRCLSSSYAPNIGQPGHESMIAELDEIFRTHQKDGFVMFEYQTQITFGQFIESVVLDDLWKS